MVYFSKSSAMDSCRLGFRCCMDLRNGFFSVFMTFLVQNENFNKVLKLYIIQFILNVSWNYIFFNQQRTTLGLINIITLTILVFYFLVAFKASLKNNRFFILPYFIWLIVATSLNAYIVLYN